MYATLKPRNGTPIPTPLYLFNPPYLTLCSRDGGDQKSFYSKYFPDSNLFGLMIFLDPKYFWNHNFFLTQYNPIPQGGDLNLGLKIFLDPKFFLPKIFLHPKIFLNPNFSDGTIFWNQNIFGPIIFFDPT